MSKKTVPKNQPKPKRSKREDVPMEEVSSEEKEENSNEKTSEKAGDETKDEDEDEKMELIQGRKNVTPRRVEKADVEKPNKGSMPVPGKNEKLFECPQGCLKVGPSDRNEDYCTEHEIKINVKR